MKKERFWSLLRGDIIRHKGNGETYVVLRKLPDNTYIVIREIMATNPDEWTLVGKLMPVTNDEEVAP